MCLVSLLGSSLGRPSLLGASQFPSFPRARQGHSHHDHHAAPLDGLYSAPPEEVQPLDGLYSAPPVEVAPLDGLYSAPALEALEPLEQYGETVEETAAQPSYDLPPAPAPAPATMMVMDPSYSFQFNNEDSQREEENDISGVVTGSYSYKTPGGQDILVKYTAGADTGFVIQNMEELNAALERSAAEPVEVKASPYSGETAEIQYSGPQVRDDMSLELGYSYGYTSQHQAASQQADSEGEVTGSYSYNLEDGREVEVRYTAGKDGFRVENLEDLMATVHAEEDLGQYGAQESQESPESEAAVAEVVVARAQNVEEQQVVAEPYVHQDMPYVHQDMPYVHEEIEALPYVHDTTGDVAEPYDHQSGGNSRPIGRKRVAVKKTKKSQQSSAASRSFSFETEGEDQQFSEQSDSEGERIGSYSYISPEGDKITVRYSAGKNGFVILNPEEVLPQPVVL